MDQGSPGNLGKGVLHHVHHEHSPGKLMGPDHTETVHASESFEKLGLLAAHLAALHDAHMLERGLLPGTQLPDSEAPPIAPVLDEIPWKELKPVTLADMKVGKTHRRHVLQGRLCVTAYKIHSVVSVLEEDSGLATILMLKNSVPLRASMAQAQHCFPEGSRVAIRDPYLTRFPDGLVGVLVEHPTDMVFLSRPMTPEGHWAFTSPKHSESVVHNSSNDTVSQSPDSPPKVASFLVNAGVTQQGDHQKQSSVIVDADMCKRDHHTDAKEVEISFPQDNIVEPQGSAAEDVSTVRDLGAGTCQKDKDVGEVKEIFLPSKDLDEAAQSEPCHVNGDAVTGVPNADIGEAEVVSHPAVEEIKDGGSERENVVEANESGLGDLNRATVGHSDTSNSAQAGKVVSRTVVADSPKISSSKSMVEATISEKYNVDSAIDFGNSYAKSLDDAADEVFGTTATKSNSVGDATKFQKGDGYREAVSGVLGGETNRSDETKEVGSSLVMEECNEILQSKNGDDDTEVDRCNEESEDLTGISKVEAERTDDVKQVVSISATENYNELVRSTGVDEGTEDERCDEQIEDKAEASEMEEERNNESKEVVSSLAVEECNEISPSTRMDEGTEDDRHGEEIEDITRVSEVEEKTNEVKDGVGSTATEDSNELVPSTIVGEGYEDERFGDIIKDKVGASDMEAEKSDEAAEIVSSPAVEKDKFPLTSMDEVDRHDEEYKDKVGASEMEAEMSDELKGVASNPLMEDCNEIMPSTSVDEGIEHVKHDEESEEKAGASQMETERCYELKGVVSSLGMEDCNEIMPSKSVDEGIEHVETSKYEKTGEVPKPNRGEAQQEIDLSSMTKESFSAHALRLQGNKLFLHEDFHGATELYTRGILQAMKEQELTRSATSTEKSGVTNGHASESEVLLGFSNRAEAWIRLHEYEKGLEDAEKALALQHDHLKSLFRKGRALLGLHQYHDANLILREAAPRAPLDKDLQAALHESIIRVQQSEMGLFDLSNFYLKGRYVGEFPSCTDYIGPVKVAEVGHGCGRGLVLKKHVEAGELLLVSNPIAFMEVQSFDHQTGVEVSEQSINRKVQEAFGPICANPHALGWDNQKLHMLFDGVKKLPTPPANLLTSNSRCSPVAMAPLDASCIHRIIQLNAFNGNATIGWKNLPGSGGQENKVQNWGLWWLPSFINHSCMPNSSQILVGRALFVFASRELQAGEEITRGYFDIFQPHQQRKDLSTKGWGFVCHCPRCKLEDALHTPLSQVTNHYTQLMELAARPKPEKVSDAKHADNQATTALRFSHELERKLKDLKLRAVEENWIRGSFVHFIDLITSEHELSPHLELVVEAMAAVCPGSESTVHMSVLAKDSAKHTTGKKSVQFKSAHHRAMHICRCTYGKQKSSVLQALVDRDDH